MPRRKQPQLPCVGCGAEITGYRRNYCTLQCGERHRSQRRAQRALAQRIKTRAIPRACANPGCDKSFTGVPNKLYCSSHCNHAVNHKRPSIEYERGLRAKRNQSNIIAAPLCSIPNCGNSTARRGYYNSQSTALSLLPNGFNLCPSHFRGYSFFTKTINSQDPDELFTAYLIHQAFGNSSRQPYITMIREAFEVSKVCTPAPSAI